MRIIAVQRDERFSPNSVAKDKAILRAVCERMERQGAAVRMLSELELTADDHADLYLSMARSGEALKLLMEKESAGAKVLNSAFGVNRCNRSRLTELMLRNDIPIPPTEGDYGFWLKRGDQAAQSPSDVVFCENQASLSAMQAAFVARGIDNWVVQAHVPGDLVKFYAVHGSFFRYFYPSDDGISKFGDEVRNGIARHYPFDEKLLRRTADAVSEQVGVLIYGGDAIVKEDGCFCLIDFNDWPSYSRCQSEAADAICGLINKK